VEFNAAAQLSDDLEPAPSQPADKVGSKQAAFADKAFQQTTIVLEQVAAGIEGLSGEVRRVGRELFKTARAAERNQDLFDSAIAELRQLTQRVEQVPAQLRGSESIVEVKAALCREMLGVVDALEASLIAAQMRLEQLRERVESARGDGRAGSSEIKRSLPQRLFRRWSFQRERSSQQAPRAPSPRTGRVEDGGAPRDMLDEAVATLDQWLGGQRLLYERLQMVLQSAGVRRIESEGQSFDPSRHRAVSTEARDDVPPGTIVGEEMRGYMLDGRILRYAEVIVAKNEQDSRH
jgi:molecular chaperone GrpE (heat shock protein)